ncbi:hypothetical protein [Actomonas aquatica]|uniref:Uncharacterized protein n=1 Tax=Actomonas aquatica TaxID=2866162 RepID=A0ABZ1CAG0_9BACT|nr:hypothetical protein [Opitutus sp. WL0086]WRQ88521.1 hypothetical protein K1X11_003840 [Opitutus sp. WL0086]
MLPHSTTRLSFGCLSQRLRCAALVGLGIAGGVAAALAQNPPKQSPFATRGQPAGGNPAAATAPADAMLEFSGIMKIGQSTMVCITTLQDKRTHWIKVGETNAGIHVPAQEAPTNAVLVRHQGREVTLPFKQPVFDAAAAANYQLSSLPTGPAPQAGIATPVAVTNEEKEAEARMLVSDLLEIGLIQRKAYQDAKKQELDEKRAETQAAAEAAAATRTVPQR